MNGNKTTKNLPLLEDGAPPSTHASTEKRTMKRKNMIVDGKSLQRTMNVRLLQTKGNVRNVIERSCK